MIRDVARSRNYKWWAFAVVALGLFTMVLDQSGLGIALPKIASHFRTDLLTGQWVLLGYTLAISVVLLPAGRLSDIVGRKPVYLLGAFIFTLGGGLSGASPTLILLILFKVVQGIGTGMMTANTMAIIAAIFPGRERGQGMGLMSAAVGLGSIAGPVVGGSLVTAVGWRAVFFLGVLLGVVTLVASVLVFEERRIAGVRAGSGRPPFDWVGATLSAAGLVLLLLALSNGQRLGWLSPLVLVGLLGFLVLLVLFIAWELRTSAPMFDLGLFKRRVFSFGVTARTLAMLGTSSALFLMPFYLQGVLGYTAGQAGVMMVSGALGMVLAGPISGRLSDRFGWRPFAIAGLVLVTSGMFVLSRLTEDPLLGVVVAGLALQGLGMGIFISPNLSSIIGSVEGEKHGVVAAFVNLNRTAANLAGVAVATAIVAAVMVSAGYEPRLDVASDGSAGGVAHAFTAGMRSAYLIMGGCVFLGLIVTLIELRRAGRGREAPRERQTAGEEED